MSSNRTDRDYTAHLAEVRRRQDRVRPSDVPREAIHPLGELTVPEYVDAWAARHPQRPAVVHGGRTLDYAALADGHARWAGWLAGAATPGDRIAVHLGNVPEFVLAMIGTLRAGGVHVPLNPMFLHGELVHELNDSSATVVVTSIGLVERILGTCADTAVRTVVVVGEGELPAAPDGVRLLSWNETQSSSPLIEPAPDLDALAALNYTGGTTGVPKGCMHSQRHMVYTAVSAAQASGLDGADGDLVSLCFIPVFWIAGEDLGILIPLVMGGTSVLLSRWDPDLVVDLVERHRVSFTAATVENYLEILDLPGVQHRDLSSLTGPMTMSFIRKLTPEIRRRWMEVIGEQSLIREGSYGMTESHTVDVVPYGFQDGDYDLLTEPVFCGLPVPGTDVLVVDPVTAEPMPLNEHGEILLRSPSIMIGYWGNERATAEQLRGGWLHTGDTGYLDDDGALHYLARSKDMIKVNGMSVFPAEVELFLGRHPAVAMVAVVPIDDDETGQRPVAFVSLRDDAVVTAEEIQDWARSQMAGYKVPLVRIVAAFPLTATGKIRKSELLEDPLHYRRTV